MLIFKSSNVSVNPYIKWECSKTYIWCESMLLYITQY